MRIGYDLEENVIKTEFRIVKTEFRDILLRYDLLEKQLTAEEGGGSYFDIRIRQYKECRQDQILELEYFEETCGITDDRMRAVCLYRLLIRGRVLPESLIDVVDDQMYFWQDV